MLSKSLHINVKLAAMEYIITVTELAVGNRFSPLTQKHTAQVLTLKSILINFSMSKSTLKKKRINSNL